MNSSPSPNTARPGEGRGAKHRQSAKSSVLPSGEYAHGIEGPTGSADAEQEIDFICVRQWPLLFQRPICP